MSYKNFIMYLATIPDISPDDEDDEATNSEAGKTDPKAPAPKNKATGSFHLFDLNKQR